MEHKQRNNFLKHFSVIGIGTFINLIIGFLTTPLITRIVNPTEYGKLSIFSMYESIAVMILCLGLDQALVRYYYEYDNYNYKKVLLLRCVKLPTIICLIASVTVIILAKFDLVQFEFDFKAIILLCIYCFLGLIYRFSQLIVRLSYKSKLYAALNIIQKITYVGCAILLLLATEIDDFVVLAIATVFAIFVCVIISMSFQKEFWSIQGNDEPKCSVTYIELLKYAYPYIFALGITTLFQAIDKIFLNLYCSYSEVGVYSSAMSLIHIFAVIQTTFNTLWAPMAVEHYSKDKNDRKFYQHGNQIITVVMFFIGISLILFKDMFALLLGEKYREAAYILPFLIFNPIMYTISETTVSGLVFMKKSNMQVIVALGACVANIIGNALLVPKYGCQGAAISTGLSYIIFFSLRTFFSNRYFYIDFKLSKFYTLTFAVVLYAFYNTFVHFNLVSVIGYMICLCILGVLYKETIIYCLKYVASMLCNYKR